ncbi:hypothetical protein ACIG0D_16905 [Streptomyces sp. NPDC052773]|jgi:hypothetical protein|uniref:hypothetical protein n=1 Tax=Streptomyces sp. NPDC052773 TaxID=3365693 RepID=UPI0037CED8C8
MEISSWVGVEMARFGESRATLRERIGGDRSSFRREPHGPLIDHYVEAGLLLSFDASDRLDFIEIVKPAEVEFAGTVLSGRPFGVVVSDLLRNGVAVDLDDSGCTLRGSGIALYTPAPDEPDVEVEGVSVFSELGQSSGDLPGPEGHVAPPGDTLF